MLRHLLDSNGSSLGTAATTFDYDIWSNVVQVTDPNGRTVHREYDGYGRLKKVRDGLSSQPGQANEVDLEYLPGRDLVVKSTQRIFDDGPSPAQKSYVTELELDLVGRATKRHVKGLDGLQSAHTHAYAYDGLGQLVRYQDPDQFGDPTRFARTTFDADGRWVRFVKSASASDVITLLSEYVDTPASGNNPTVTRKDGRGLPTAWIYDAAYRLSEQRRPGYNGGSTHRTLLAYDAGSRPEWIVDGNGNYINQTWDLAARRFKRTVAPGSNISLLATEETVEFDPLGRIQKTWTDQGINWNLLMGGVEFDWDSLGRNKKESFTYTGIDVSSPVNVTSGYVHSGSPIVGDTGFRRSLGYSSGFDIGSVPDAIGRLDSRTLELPGSSTPFNLASYTWGGATALERVISAGGSSSITKTTSLDNYRRLASLTHQVAGAGTPFEQRSFEWTPGGDLLKRAWTKQDGSQGDLFQYDGHHRLIGAKQGVANISQPYGAATAAREVSYALEPGQSRDSVTETLNGQNPTTTDYTNEANSSRYSQVGGIVPIHDGEGNLVFDGRYYLLYDFKNRLSEIWEIQASGEQAAATMQQSGGLNVERSTLTRGRREVLDRFGGDVRRAIRERSRSPRASSTLRGQAPSLRSSSGALTGGESTDFTVVLIAVYGYDPFNRRIVRVVPDAGLDLRYAYDGWREVEELVPVVQGQATIAQARKTLVWGAQFTELLAYYRWNEAGGGVWDGYMVTQDEQGSVTALHDASGNLVERVEYDPYGERTVYPAGGGSQATSSVGLDFSFTTYRHDQETGFLYARNRYLHARWGRFVTVDPAGPWIDGENLGNAYSHTGNSATDIEDSLGLQSVSSHGGSPTNRSLAKRGDRPRSSGASTPAHGQTLLPDPPEDTVPTTSGTGSVPRVRGGSCPGSTTGEPGPTPGDSDGLTLCERLGLRIDAAAMKARTYGEFIDWARRHGSPTMDFERSDIGKQVLGEDRNAPPGFNPVTNANGVANARHFLGGLAGGPVVALLEANREYFLGSSRSPDEHTAEIASDILAGMASRILHEKVFDSVSFPKSLFAGLSGSAWRRNRNLPGQIWRMMFCIEYWEVFREAMRKEREARGL
ncbi:MAG: hypothetical protein HZB39_09865 [Planctomycetes bacterium]|nr:hypothetical protein [Planctomycetota bacterium]